MNPYAILANMSIFLTLFFPLLGYLFGSLPFSIWITRHVKHVDVRDFRLGSRHNNQYNSTGRFWLGRACSHSRYYKRVSPNFSGAKIRK